MNDEDTTDVAGFTRSPDFVTALDRGLSVLSAFSQHNQRMTLSEVGALVGLSRGTARRYLLTLQALHYVESDGRYFWLTPRVLKFSNAYLSTLGITEVGRPIIRRLTDLLGESSSMGVLDGYEIVYVARVETRRIYSSGLDVGSRLPAHKTSMGRIILAGLSEEHLESWLEDEEFRRRLNVSTNQIALVRAKIQEARDLEYALVDGELEIGVISIAVPIRDLSGQTVAALNVGTSTARADSEHAINVFLPALRDAAAECETTLKLWQR